MAIRFHRARSALSLLRRSKFSSHSNKLIVTPFASFSFVGSHRSFSSTSSSSPPSTLSSTSSVESAPLAASILSKAKFHRVYDMLGKDKRVKIPQVDFFKICFENGLSTDEAKSLRTSLHDSGLILYFPRGSSEYSRLHDEIIIKPKEVSRAFMTVLDVDHRYVNMYSLERKKQLEQLQTEIAPYEEKKAQLEYKAHRYADRCISASMVGLTAMSAAIVRLTFWDLSWDIMEPVTYMLNLATMTTSLYFFVIYGNEFAYPTLHQRIKATRLEKYYRRHKFDVGAFEAMAASIKKIQDELKEPETFYLRQLASPTIEAIDAAAAAPAGEAGVSGAAAGDDSADNDNSSSSSSSSPSGPSSPEKIAQS